MKPHGHRRERKVDIDRGIGNSDGERSRISHSRIDIDKVLSRVDLRLCLGIGVREEYKRDNYDSQERLHMLLPDSLDRDLQ